MSKTRVHIHRLGVAELFLSMSVVVFIATVSYIQRDVGISERSLPMAKNFDVVASFLEHTASQGAISTNGKELMSFGVKIARWDRDEILMPDVSTFHSITTTKHRNLVRGMARGRGIIVKERN